MSDDFAFPHCYQPYGFAWGPLEVERILSDPRFGVVIRVSSEKEQVDIRVSPQGRRLQVYEVRPKEAHDDPA